MLTKQWFVAACVGLVVVVAMSLIAIRAVGERSDQVDQLTTELAAATAERDELEATQGELTATIEENRAGAALVESRWLAAVAVSGDHAISQSRLLAVEAITRSHTPEAMAALGQLLFADTRADPPIIQLDHGGPVWVTDAVAVGDVVATGSDDTTVKLWSTTGDLLSVVPHDGRVRAVAFSADGERLATGSADGAATSWTMAGDRLASVRHDGPVNDVALGGDGAVMISAGHDGAVIVADSETGTIDRELAHDDIVWTVTLSADERQLVSGGQDGIATVWDLGTGESTTTYDLGQPVTVVEYSPDGRWLFVGGQRGNAFVINTDDGMASESLQGSLRGGIIDVDWHPERPEIAVVSIGGIHRYDLATATLTAEHQLAGGARGVAYGPDGSWFVTASGDFQFSFGEVAFWDSTHNTKLLSLNLGGPVESISTHPNGSVVASFRAVEDLVEVGGALLVPGPDAWIALACEGTDATISEQTWNELTGESTSRTTGCP